MPTVITLPDVCTLGQDATAKELASNVMNFSGK